MIAMEVPRNHHGSTIGTTVMEVQYEINMGSITGASRGVPMMIPSGFGIDPVVPPQRFHCGPMVLP